MLVRGRNFPIRKIKFPLRKMIFPIRKFYFPARELGERRAEAKFGPKGWTGMDSLGMGRWNRSFVMGLSVGFA